MTKYNNDIYKMYEEELNKKNQVIKELKDTKLELQCTKDNYKYLQKRFDNKVIHEVENSTKPLNETINKLNNELSLAYDEINRLRSQLNNDKEEKDYQIDKLTNQVNKDHTNSSISTGKEMIGRHEKSSANTYNNREKSNRQSGGQPGHEGTTLTKSYVQKLINEGKTEVETHMHYINGNIIENSIVKYRLKVKTEVVVEEHIFVKTPKSNDKLPKEFYSDVTYDDSLKSLITIVGNYLCSSYEKTKEFISDLTGGIINISEGTIDNIY